MCTYQALGIFTCGSKISDIESWLLLFLRWGTIQNNSIQIENNFYLFSSYRYDERTRGLIFFLDFDVFVSRYTYVLGEGCNSFWRVRNVYIRIYKYITFNAIRFALSNNQKKIKELNEWMKKIKIVPQGLLQWYIITLLIIFMDDVNFVSYTVNLFLLFDDRIVALVYKSRIFINSQESKEELSSDETIK